MVTSTTIVDYKTVPIGGAKNGGTRKIAIRKSLTKPASKPTPAVLRPSLVPGTVCILLAGRFRGRRVIFLKQCEKSGLLVVTGPHKINGVPLRRVSQSYVIATSVKVDLTGVNLPDDIFNDGLFIRVKGNEKKLCPELKALQKQIDDAIVPKVKAIKQLTGYLKILFSLKKGQAPHSMNF
jgi:large subunit ribosomal protein L6e